MAFSELKIELTADASALSQQLDRAVLLVSDASTKIRRSADSAGLALGDAANSADFGSLSKQAQSAAASIDAMKTASVGAGSAVGGLSAQVKQLLEQISSESQKRYDQAATGAKVAGAVAVAAVAYGLVQIGELFAATALRIAEGAKTAGEFVAGIFTGTSLQSKYIDGLISANDKVKDLQVSLGVTAQAADALRLALTNAGVAQGDFVGVFTATERAVASGADAFKLLGIAYQDTNGKTLSTQQIIANASRVLDTYTAGIDRNAAAAALGIGAADKVGQAAKLNGDALDAAGERLKAYHLLIGPVTQAAVAEYQQAMREFQSETQLTSDGFKHAIADSTLPILTELAEQFKEGFPDAVSAFREALTGLVAVFQTLEAGLKAVDQIGGAALDSLEISVETSIAGINKALHLDFGGIKKDVEDGAKAIEARFEQMLDNLTHNRDKLLSNVDLAAGKDSQGATPSLSDKDRGKTYFGTIDFGKSDDKSGAASNVDVRKKLLETQLKTLDLFIGNEKELLTNRDAFLDLSYQHGDESIADYYTKREAIQQLYLESARKGYADEEAALKDYIAKTHGDESISAEQRQARTADASTRLIEVQDKLRKAESDATNESLKGFFARRAAAEQFGDTLSGLAAQIATFSGDSASAFAITFANQNRLLEAQLHSVRQSDTSTPADRNAAAQALVDLDQIKRQGIATAQLNDLTSQRSVILDQLSNTQSRISLAVSTGQKTELEGLAATSAANQSKLADLQKIIDAEQKIAEGIDDPFARSQALASVDKMRVEMQQLASQTDLVADKFNELGRSATENFFDKILNRTATVKEALKGLGTDLLSSLSKVTAQNASESLFGKDGPLSGFGKALGSVFGGSAGKATTGAGTTTGITALSAAASPAATAVSALSRSAASASTALDSLTGGAGGSGGAGLFGSSGASDGAGGDSSNVSLAGGIFGLLAGGLGELGSGSGSEAGNVGWGGRGLSGLNSISNVLISTMQTLKQAADHAAQALNSVNSSGGGGGGGGDYSSLFSDDSGGSTGGIFDSLLESAKGNIFSGGNVIPFAKGGVVNSPHIFPLKNGGVGLMGEAGPEAIIPLKRGANGSLGVANHGGGGTTNVVINNNYNDAKSRQSAAQITNTYQRAINQRQLTRSA